jgi:hypothetical protein
LIALGPDGRAEGGAALIILWLVPAELVGLVVTEAVLRAVDRRRRSRRLGSNTGRPQTLHKLPLRIIARPSAYRRSR